MTINSVPGRREQGTPHTVWDVMTLGGLTEDTPHHACETNDLG